MNEAVLTTIAITGFGVAFFHSAIPTHWLPFVLTSRVQKWNRPKTVAITALAGSGHAAITALLGLCITWFGIALNRSIGDWVARLGGGVLLIFGSYYLVRQFLGKGHVHAGYPHEHLHEADVAFRAPRRTSDRAAILSLLAFLTFSPCEAFLPIYVSGIRFGWKGFVFLTAILSIATVVGMVLFTSLTMAGLSRLNLSRLEKYESALIGVLLCIVGLLVLAFEQ